MPGEDGEGGTLQPAFTINIPGKPPVLCMGSLRGSFGSCKPGDSAPPDYSENPEAAAAAAAGEADAEHEEHGTMYNSMNEVAQAIYDYMKSVINAEIELDKVQIKVVPMWRVTKVTGLETQLPDDTVPPPPLPPTPVPPIDLDATEEEVFKH